MNDSFRYYCEDTTEINVLLMMERRLTCNIISTLSERVDSLTSDQESMNLQLREAEDKLYKFRSKFTELKREGNALKKYNPRLLINSFVSDLTDVPKKEAHSLTRVKQLYRNFSTTKINEMMCDLPGDQDPSSKSKFCDDNSKNISSEGLPISYDITMSDLNNLEINPKIEVNFKK
jgi:predicted RNase H-like nuclease (RuvC/YqgF family)